MRCAALQASILAGAAFALSCGGTGSTTVRSDVPVLCAEDAVKPGKYISVKTKICNQLTIDDLVLSADFSTTGASDNLVEIYPGTHITDIHEAATFAGGTAILHSSGSEQEADVAPLSWFQASPPADSGVVVDFKGLSHDSTLGFSPRCSDDACIGIGVNGDGIYRFSARIGASWSYPATGNLGGDTGSPAPRLDPVGENRLIVWLSNGRIGGSLNGRFLGSLKVKPPAVKQAFLFYRSGNPNQSTQVAVTRIFFFSAGQ